MKFLIPDKGYWETGEVTANFGESILAEARLNLDEAAQVDDVDAGPSASVPAVILDVMSSVADGIAIIAGPMVLLDGVRWWKERFAKAAAFLASKSLDFSVDKNTALLLAAAAAYDDSGAQDDLEIVSITRHWANLNGIWSEHQEFDPEEEDPWLPNPHFEAVKQLAVRYVVLLRQGTSGYTAIVEKDGSVSAVYRL
jgi:hypothetical protein